MMHDDRLDQLKEHLYNGLAIIDVVGHIEDPGTLWRRDSLAYAMRLVFKEWQAVDALLSRLEEEPPDEWRRGPHVKSPVSPEEKTLHGYASCASTQARTARRSSGVTLAQRACTRSIHGLLRLFGLRKPT
jgi:hypothetical protein